MPKHSAAIPPVAKLEFFGPWGRKRIYQKISIEPRGGGGNVYTHKFLYENYIYNTTGRKKGGGGGGAGAPPRPSYPSPMHTVGNTKTAGAIFRNYGMAR
ncbi:hypothetical protein Hanom_Chr14g01318541 [Helianthus anomalus]